jgi:tryptophanase
MYLDVGIRSCEIGSVMFGLRPDGSKQESMMDLVRLAIPRRLYTQSHIDYVAEAIVRVAARREELPAYRITHSPKVLRHFTAKFEMAVPEMSGKN